VPFIILCRFTSKKLTRTLIIDRAIFP